MCIYGFDLSLSNTGVAIMDNDGNLKEVFSIKTNDKLDHPLRLKKIADVLLEYRNKYPPCVAVFEQGFFRHNKSTQAIFKVVGLVQYLFSDCKQYFYAPLTVKKLTTGRGNATKEEVLEKIVELYDIGVDNYDQSDALGVLTAYLKEKAGQ